MHPSYLTPEQALAQSQRNEQVAKVLRDGALHLAAAAAVPEPTEEWAIVEIFGHRSHAGRLYEVERFGSKMLRIDVTVELADGVLQVIESPMYGGAAIFSITPCTREVVLDRNAWRRPAPAVMIEGRLHDADEAGEIVDDGEPSDFFKVEDPAPEPPLGGRTAAEVEQTQATEPEEEPLF